MGRGGRGLNLPVALAQAAHWYGMEWLVNRAFWGTQDGWPDVRQFWWWYKAIGAGRAWDRLDIARAVSLTQADATDRQRAVLDEQRVAHGD